MHPKEELSKMPKKIKKSLTFDEAVLERIEAYADMNGLSLSSALSVLSCQKLDEIQVIQKLDGLKELYNKLQEVQDQLPKA